MRRKVFVKDKEPDKNLSRHFVIMFALSLTVMYVTRQYSVAPGMDLPRAAGLITGRAFAVTILPFLLAAIPAALYKLIKGEKDVRVPGFHFILWLLWMMITLTVTVGSMINPA